MLCGPARQICVPCHARTPSRLDLTMSANSIGVTLLIAFSHVQLLIAIQRPPLQGALREEGRHPVHRQRPLLLQPGAGDQRGRRRRRAVRLHQGLQHRVAAHVPQLGSELAEQLAPRRPEPLIPGHLQRRPHRHQQQRRAGRMAVRPDLRRRPVLDTSFYRSINPFIHHGEYYVRGFPCIWIWIFRKRSN
jgi:hypothetical protein